MKRMVFAGLAAAALVGTVAAVSAAADPRQRGGRETIAATAVLIDAAGNAVGIATFGRAGNHTVVRVQVARLTPGFHGFHVHAVGVCDPPFTSAGGHYDSAGRPHGAHAGDMPPLLVNADGTGSASFTTDRFTPAELLAGDGSAVIVHAAPDNLAHVPSRYHSHVPDATSTTFGPDATTLATGDAGARVACGVVRRG